MNATDYPTSPPKSTYRKGVPTIDGSEGGFIGLVVGLGLLFIGCSLAVFLLLRRRNSIGRRPLPFFNKSIGGRGKGAAPANTSGGVFGRLGQSDRHGWVRTGEDDSDDEGQGHGRASGASVKLSDARARSPNPPTPNREREGLYSNDSNPFATPSTAKFQYHAPGPYDDAFNARPSTDSLDEAVHGRYPGASSSTHTAASPPLSPAFERGTKFKEGF